MASTDVPTTDRNTSSKFDSYVSNMFAKSKEKQTAQILKSKVRAELSSQSMDPLGDSLDDTVLKSDEYSDAQLGKNISNAEATPKKSSNIEEIFQEMNGSVHMIDDNEDPFASKNSTIMSVNDNSC